MKLSAHYNKTSVIITITVLVIGAVIYFFAINYIARKQLDRDLSEEIEEVVDYINQNGKLPRQVDFDEDQTSFIKTSLTGFQTRFFDTIYNNPKEKNAAPGRAISGFISLQGEHYIVTITVSRESTEFLIQIIALITLLLMIGLLVTLFLTNRFILSGLWGPFYETLYQLKSLNLSDKKNLQLKPNKVDEFRELNEVVQSMAVRVKDDYQHLKEFTENASHEIMTPLAIITSKLDTLIQDESLSQEQFGQISDIYAASGKLSRLNQSLLLLVKIENNQVNDIEILRIDELLQFKIRQFNELIISKEIEFNEQLEKKNVTASRYLIDIMLNNLFSNGIRHNYQQGKFFIILTHNKLIFRNTGAEKALNSDKVFDRFQKGQKSGGMGLGLTIVKNICTLYHWDINYCYENSMHTFQIVFA